MTVRARSPPRHRARSAPVPELLSTVAEVVSTSAPELHVERRWGRPWRAGRDLVLCFAPYSHHVRITFWKGSALVDPAGLLSGTGDGPREVTVRSEVDARAPALQQLIRAAVRLDRASPPVPR